MSYNLRQLIYIVFYVEYVREEDSVTYNNVRNLYLKFIIKILPLSILFHSVKVIGRDTGRLDKGYV